MRIPIMIASCVIVFLLAAGFSADQSSLTPLEQLGKNLFFDKISDPPWVSCATCHAPAAGWVGGIPGINMHGAVYRGAIPQRFGNRKPPTSAYSTFSPIFHQTSTDAFVGGSFWDGRATGERLGNPAADQALGPFLNPVEQNMPSKEEVCRHLENSSYADLFEEVWGPEAVDCSSEGVDGTYDRIGLSIANYEASTEVSPFSSKFDNYWVSCLAAGNNASECGLGDGDQGELDPEDILSPFEWAGLTQFGVYCSTCHVSSQPGPDSSPPLFTDFTYDNIGVPRNPENPFYRMDEVLLDNGTAINPLGEAWVDYGLGDFLRTRAEFLAFAADNDGKFKVPTVRNVDKRPGRGFPKAYMHNGVFKSLREVVRFYNTRDVPEENWPPPEVSQNVNRELLDGVPLGNLGLSTADEEAIVAFLRTLSDGYKGHRRVHRPKKR